MRALDMNPDKAPAIVATSQLARAKPAVVAEKRTVPWMLWWIVLVHFSWGVALIAHPPTLDALVLIGIDWIADWDIPARGVGIMLCGISLLAAAGLLVEDQLRTAEPPWGLGLMIVLLCPQYFVVLAAMVSDLNLIIEGSFNGREVDRWLLLGALAPVVWGALFHTASILERYVLAWRR